MASVQCPSNSFRYNTTLCACNPGYLYNATTKSCDLFSVYGNEWMMDSGVGYSITFPATIFSFDSIKKFTQSQAVFLEATVIMLLSWLAFCFFVRFGNLGDGRTIWFKIRWWISRLDVCFATRHWLVILFLPMYLYMYVCGYSLTNEINALAKLVESEGETSPKKKESKG
ncbi:unnamed protein product [Ilex paraguariensis]|uniref:Uncharacterized protein n=1 Tax=Ilex paraguariensis TaxID=185542 RepID=A0ABC8UM89_9AQUA